MDVDDDDDDDGLLMLMDYNIENRYGIRGEDSQR
jgi:hypothetical protein